MDEQKRRTATQKRVSEFRATNPELTDEKIASIVETLYPNKYNSLEAGIEIIKELYRDNKELTEENFKSTLTKLNDLFQLKKYDKAELRSRELFTKKQNLIEKIYKDASVKTVYLSQYSEFDEELKAYFEKEVYPDGDLTLAQKFYKLFCNYQFTGYPPFHSYSEPNGDIIFTKKRRSADDYDSNGKPKGNSSSSGCLGIVLLFIFFLIGMIAKAQSGKYDIPVYQTYVDADDTEGTIDSLTNSTAYVGNTGVTLTFGNFTAYVFIWKGEPEANGERVSREAIDLVSGNRFYLTFEKAKSPYDYVLQFCHPSGRTLIFPLLKIKE